MGIFSSGGTTLKDLISYDNTLLDGIMVPAGCSRDTVINAIFDRCWLQTMLYPEPEFFRTKVNFWSLKNAESFNKMWATVNVEYNPLEDYDMNIWHKFDNSKDTDATRNVKGTNDITDDTDNTVVEDVDDTFTGKEVDSFNEHSSSDGVTEDTVSAYNTASYQPDNKATSNASADHNSSDNKTTNNTDEKHRLQTNDTRYTRDQDTSTNDVLDQIVKEDENYYGRDHGRKTSAQELIQKERALAEFVFYDWVSRKFEEAFCLMVY